MAPKCLSACLLFSKEPLRPLEEAATTSADFAESWVLCVSAYLNATWLSTSSLWLPTECVQANRIANSVGGGFLLGLLRIRENGNVDRLTLLNGEALAIGTVLWLDFVLQ